MFTEGPSLLKFLNTNQKKLSVILSGLQIISTVRYPFLKVIYVSDNAVISILAYQHLPMIVGLITEAPSFLSADLLLLLFLYQQTIQISDYLSDVFHEEHIEKKTISKCE